MTVISKKEEKKNLKLEKKIIIQLLYLNNIKKIILNNKNIIQHSFKKKQVTHIFPPIHPISHLYFPFPQFTHPSIFIIY